MKQLNLGAAQGIAVRENPTDAGPADYVLVPQDPNDEPASMLLDRIRAERAARKKPAEIRPARLVVETK